MEACTEWEASACMMCIACIMGRQYAGSAQYAASYARNLQCIHVFHTEISVYNVYMCVSVCARCGSQGHNLTVLLQSVHVRVTEVSVCARCTQHIYYMWATIA